MSIASVLLAISGNTAFDHYSDTAISIESLWLRADIQQVPSWLDDADINAVTLATSLLPDEFLAV